MSTYEVISIVIGSMSLMISLIKLIVEICRKNDK